jgi:hypothetical protein
MTKALQWPTLLYNLLLTETEPWKGRQLNFLIKAQLNFSKQIKIKKRIKKLNFIEEIIQRLVDK